MPLTAPNLDDREFEELLREARQRIPRYCPEWTDFNESDPGMAIVQLFAWFTDLMIYRLNQVPERSYIKFLQMLNLELRPPKPARTHVVLTTAADAGVTTVRKRSRFSVPSEEGNTLPFETTSPIDLNPYRLQTVQVKDGIIPTDFSSQNELGNDRFRPFGWNPQAGNALYLGFRPKDMELKELKDALPGWKKTKDPIFPERLILRVFLPPADAASPTFAETPPKKRRPTPVVWEYQSDLDLVRSQHPETLDRWRPLTAFTDESESFTREGMIELRGPGKDILPTLGGLPPADNTPRYWIRCRLLEEVAREAIPEIAFVRSNVVEVENLATFHQEVLGESDGFRREFTLRHHPVVPESLTLIVEGTGEDTSPWTRKEDFLSSKVEDRHYVLQPANGKVLFGDGRQGRLPAPGSLVIAEAYRAGGGAEGNVSAHAITAPPAGVGNIESVTNPRRASGGTDEETLEELKNRAPEAIRGDSRAVTAEDYKQFALKVDGVARATAIPLAHPDHRGMKIPGVISVVVVPELSLLAAAHVPGKPIPDQELLDRVARELHPLRTVGTELFITGPQYIDVKVTAAVIPTRGISPAKVKQGIQRAIERYLSPVKQTVKHKESEQQQKASEGWPFGGTFYPSRLYEVILSAKDEPQQNLLVQAVRRLVINYQGEDLDCEKLSGSQALDDDQLLFGVAEVEIADGEETA